jgi:YegS C-terminal NAD kinase beta sandwich-like domain
VIRAGEPWGGAASGPATVTGAGSDADLAALVRDHPGARVGFRPDATCDLARAVGLRGAADATVELPLDALDLGDGALAVNLVVSGAPPDRQSAWRRRRPVAVTVGERTVFDGRALGVVIANGQFRAGCDLVPRGHPGDGRLEVQVYALPPGQRRAFRARVGSGSHLPHPAIVTAAGHQVRVVWAHPAALEVDGRPRAPAAVVEATVRPDAYRLLV